MAQFLTLVLMTCIVSIYGQKYPALSKPIDIGFGLHSNSLTYPGYAPFRYTKRATGHWGSENGPWYVYNEFASSEHVGTAMSSPGLVIKGATALGNLPLNILMTSAIFIDVSKEVGDNWNYTLPVSKLQKWVRSNGPIPQNSVLVIKFGWSSRYPNKTLYLGPSDTDLRWPGITKETAEWIVNTGKIVGVGSDTASLTPGSALEAGGVEDFIIFSNNIYGLQMLNLKANLPPKFNIMVAPMKFTEGPAGPTRVIAY